MTNIFIIHGFGGHPNKNWFQWLKTELEKLGNQVFVPQFPTPNNQSLEKWFKVLEKYKEYINEETIFIGHSLGAAFILNLLEKQAIKATFLVAGFIGNINFEFNHLMRTFAHKEFDWNIINNNCQKFFIFHSNNDPFIKLEIAEKIAENLNTKVILIENGQHLSQKWGGFTQLPILLEEIKTVMN
ncbi:MAG: alpha/beta hydrolase [Candidatus Woesearchaeota archaeon]